MDKDTAIITCPPYCDYPEAPKDQSHSELFDCPKCEQKMWLSEKKKGVLMFSSCIEKHIILACYHCIIKMALDDPALILGSKQVDL